MLILFEINTVIGSWWDDKGWGKPKWGRNMYLNATGPPRIPHGLPHD